MLWHFKISSVFFILVFLLISEFHYQETTRETQSKPITNCCAGVTNGLRAPNSACLRRGRHSCFGSECCTAWWGVNSSTARKSFSCTHTHTHTMPSSTLDRLQAPFFKSSTWLDRESNPNYQLWWRVLNKLYSFSCLSWNRTENYLKRNFGNLPLLRVIL